MKLMWAAGAVAAMALAGLWNPGEARAQVGSFSKQDLIEMTSQWTGERFPDGRPKVPDALLERLKAISLNDAVSVLLTKGYKYQFAGDFIHLNEDKVLVGRAVTVQFMPLRPDMAQGNDKIATRNGDPYGTNKSKLFPTLNRYDVPVADIFGKGAYGTYIGGAFAAQIFARTGTGFIVDGNVIDIEDMRKLPNFPVYARAWHPTHSQDIQVVSTNAPIMIGGAPVMPGDAVLGRDQGVVFIPAHLVQEVVERSEAAMAK